jgi:hypothetical protein
LNKLTQAAVTVLLAGSDSTVKILLRALLLLLLELLLLAVGCRIASCRRAVALRDACSMVVSSPAHVTATAKFLFVV